MSAAVCLMSDRMARAQGLLPGYGAKRQTVGIFGAADTRLALHATASHTAGSVSGDDGARKTRLDERHSAALR